MKRHHYAVMFLVLLVGVLTGFVANTQQAPTRWEYAQFSLSIERINLFEWSGMVSWQSAEGSRSFSNVPLEMAIPQLLGDLGCEDETATEVIYLVHCLGAQGWEMFHVAETRVEQVNDRSYWFKRPVQ